MPDVLIVGGGLAGLSCALRLQAMGRSSLILEASDGVGGRVRTDVVDGFRLDRGFQVLLTAYPEVRRTCDVTALKLRPFARGALIRYGGRFHRFVDPRRDWLRGIGTMLGPIGTVSDKWKLLNLESKVRAGSAESQFEKSEGLTLDLLRWHGFTDSIIDRFFRPFFGGVFLERDLVTSSRMFRFVFRMFAEGEAALPELGMSAIPEQLAAQLPSGAIRSNAQVSAVEPSKVTLNTGETLSAQAVVIATDAPVAAQLLKLDSPAPARSVTCLYFAANESPVREPILVLDAEGRGPINNLAVLSDVAPNYAPPGKSLISVSVLGDPQTDDAALEKIVRQQLGEWFGSAVTSWRHLKTYRIRHALPDQTAPALDPAQRPIRLSPGLFVCGDHRDNASINGALHSGWRAAQAVGEQLHAKS